MTARLQLCPALEEGRPLMAGPARACWMEQGHDEGHAWTLGEALTREAAARPADRR